MSQASEVIEAPKSFMQKLLDMVERVGNKVPHPAMIFLLLIGLVVVLSHILYLLGTSVSYQVLNPETHKVERRHRHREQSADGGRHPLHVRVGHPEFHELQRGRGHHRGHGGRRGGRGGRPGARLDSQAGERLAGLGSHLHPGVRGGHIQHRGGCRLPGADSAGRGRLPQRGPTSAGRAGRVLCRGGRRLRGEHSDQTARWHPDRDHQRRDPPAQSDHLHRPGGQPLVFHRLRPAADGRHLDHYR